MRKKTSGTSSINLNALTSSIQGFVARYVKQIVAELPADHSTVTVVCHQGWPMARYQKTI